MGRGVVDGGEVSQYPGATRMRRKHARMKRRLRDRLSPGLAAGAALVLIAATGARAYIPVSENATLIPLPEIITDPNEGETVGALAVLLITDAQGQVRDIVAPDVRYNGITGVYPMMRWFHYPDAFQKVLLQGGKAATVGEYFEAGYSGLQQFDKWLDVRARA